MYGTVARLAPERGSGFIRSIDGREFFFHRNTLHDVALEALAAGVRVEFKIGHEPGDEVGEAPRATRVRPDPDSIPAVDDETRSAEELGD